MREKFRFCGVLNFIFIALSVLYNFSSFGLIRSIVLLITGMYLYNLTNKSDNEIKRDKSIILIIGILLLFANPISAVVLLLAVDKINLLSGNDYRRSPKTVLNSEKLDPEKRKLDILLKLGVFLVILAGFIFASTSWNGIPDIVKTLSLVIGASLFFGLSYLCEETFDLKRSSIVYYLLGICFIWCSYYSVGYFGIFGEYLSTQGLGSSLYCSSNALLISFLLYISYKKYNNVNLITPTYLTLIVAIIYLFNYFKLELGFNLLIINIILLILNIVLKNKIRKFIGIKSFTLSATYMIGLFTIGSFVQISNAAIILNSIILISSLLFITTKEKDSKLSFLNGLIVNMIIYLGSYSLNYGYYFIIITIIAVISVLYSILMYTDFLIKYKEFAKTFIILANILMLIAFITNIEISYMPSLALSYMANGDAYTIIGCSIMIFMTSMIYQMLMKSDDKLKYEYYLTPIKVGPVILAVGLCILNFTAVQILILAAFIYGLMAYFSKKTAINEENIIITLILLFLAAFTNYTDKEYISEIIIVLMTVGTYFYASKSKISILKQVKIPLLIFMLSVIYLTFSRSFFSYSEAYLSLISLLSFIGIMIFTRKDKVSYVLTGYALLFPIINIIDKVVIDKDFSLILTFTLVFYMTFLTCKNVIKNINKGSLLATIVSVISLLIIIFSNSVITGLYAGLVSLVLILIGLIDDDYRNLFVTGICFTIINIFYQLRNIWQVIPSWLYLLFIGLALIGVVTYKEIKRGSKK